MIKRAPTPFQKKARGQSLVEFAFVSIFLFLLLFGIIEMGRLLYAFNVVSNAAQEGSRYAITRPYDMVSQSEAATSIAAGTAIPTQLVVADGSCNIYDNGRQKVLGITRSDVRLSATYENASGTPVAPGAISTNRGSDNYIGSVLKVGNRVVVEATYRFNFLVPLISQFAPNGIDVKMSAARSIVNSNNSAFNCTVNYEPAPPLPTDTETPIPASTQTAAAISTSTANANATNTAVAVTSTAVANAGANANSTNTAVAKTATANANLTNTAVAKTATANATSTAVAKTSTAIADSTNTAIAANSTNTSVAQTATSAAQTAVSVSTTTTATQQLVVASFDVYKANGNNKDLDVVVWLTDQSGQYVTNANSVFVSALSSVGQSDSLFLTNMGNGSYRICGWRMFSGSAGQVAVSLVAKKTGYIDATAYTTNQVGSYCGTTPTATFTPSKTSTPTRTSTSTATYTPTSTSTPTYTPTSTPTANVSVTGTSTTVPTDTNTPTPPPTLTPQPSYTPTPVTCPYTVSVSAYKASGNQRAYVSVQVTDAQGKKVAGALVSGVIRSEVRRGTTDNAGNVCLVFNRYLGSSVTGSISVSGSECSVSNQSFTTSTSGAACQ